MHYECPRDPSRKAPMLPKPRPQRPIDRADARVAVQCCDAERKDAWPPAQYGKRGGGGRGARQGPETRPPPRRTGNAVAKFHAVPAPRASWSKTLPGSPAPSPRGPLLPTESYASLTGFSSVPNPVISMRTTSPALRYTGGFIPSPTPGGVPVAIRSPGISVMRFER